MRYRILIGVAALAVTLTASSAMAQWPPDLSKYPDWNYQWYRVGPIGPPGSGKSMLAQRLPGEPRSVNE